MSLTTSWLVLLISHKGPVESTTLSPMFEKTHQLTLNKFSWQTFMHFPTFTIYKWLLILTPQPSNSSTHQQWTLGLQNLPCQTLHWQPLILYLSSLVSSWEKVLFFWSKDLDNFFGWMLRWLAGGCWQRLQINLFTDGDQKGLRMKYQDSLTLTKDQKLTLHVMLWRITHMKSRYKRPCHLPQVDLSCWFHRKVLLNQQH